MLAVCVWRPCCWEEAGLDPNGPLPVDPIKHPILAQHIYELRVARGKMGEDGEGGEEGEEGRWRS